MHLYDIGPFSLGLEISLWRLGKVIIGGIMSLSSLKRVRIRTLLLTCFLYCGVCLTVLSKKEGTT